MKKVINKCLIAFLILLLPISLPKTNAFCEESSLIDAFNAEYIVYMNDCENAEINNDNIDLYITKSISIVDKGEQIKEQMTEDEYLSSEFRGKYFEVLSKFGGFCIKKIEYNYYPENYAQTSGGSLKLANAKKTAENKINSAQSKSEIVEAYDSYFEVLNSGLAVCVSSLTTNENSAISSIIITSDNSLIFNSDDVYKVEKFNSKIFTKNLNNKLLDNENCIVENGGVAYYFDIKLLRNGVILEDEFETPLTIKISLENLNLNGVENNDTVQIAVYDKGSVSFIDAKIENEQVVFEINKFGRYALICEGYAPKSTSVVLSFFNDYGIFVYIGFGVLLLLWLIIKFKKHKKKKKLKKEMKEFKKYQKAKEIENKSKKNKKK